MENKDRNTPLQILALITTPKSAKKAAEMFRKDSLPVQYNINAQGTATSEIMDTLGLGSSEKRLLLSIIPKSSADTMMRKLRSQLHLGAINSGIAFTVSLTGVNALLLRMLTQNTDTNMRRSAGKDGNTMKDANHTLIAAIVDRGFSTEVMDAARAAGAGGGTVVRSHRIGNEAITDTWGLSVQEEKEIVLILAESESKVTIMRSISEKCGMHSDAKGVVMSLPIDSVMGY